MTLCKQCASVIYDDPRRIIKRADPMQTIKEDCMICTRPGFDYLVLERIKIRFCLEPGCDEVTDKQYCPTHSR